MEMYRKYLLPRAVNFLCGLKPAMKQREKVVPLAEGRVLEVGAGSGLNIPFYDARKVRHLWALDPSREMWALAEKNRQGVPFDLEFLEAPAEEIPLKDNCADTVLITYSLCTILEVIPALHEISRVLSPDGKLVFCEHGIAPERSVQRWQERLNPLWKRLGGGCNLNRPIPQLLQQGGFRINTMNTMYIPGWKPACYNYWGTASQVSLAR